MTTIPTLNESAAIGLVSLAVIELHKLYSDTCGGSQELRSLVPESNFGRQMVMDADWMVGGTAFLVGAAVGAYTRSWHPLFIVMLGFGAVSWYHHGILASNPVTKDD